MQPRIGWGWFEDPREDSERERKKRDRENATTTKKSLR